ncbi:MAG TPA: DUF6496 domain-containing protein [Ferruginibacter sp.]|nr:DUF6496 domain-containing protein [Ferruginibacter sp.]
MAKFSKAAQKKVATAMKEMKKGTLKSGGSGKKVTNPKQAIAIGLSEAREKGAKAPKKKTAVKKSAKKSVPKKAVAKKAAPKKAAPKKAAPKKAASKKAAVKKDSPKKTADTQQKLTTKKSAKRKAAPKKKYNSAKGNNNQVKDESLQPVESNFPPVEENSNEIIPGIQDRTVDPIAVTDKKELAKAVTRHDPKHKMQLSGPKTTLRPSGKKPLWR